MNVEVLNVVSDAVIAVASTASAFFAYQAIKASNKSLAASTANTAKIESVQQSTDGMKAELVAATAIIAEAVGLKKGQEEGQRIAMALKAALGEEHINTAAELAAAFKEGGDSERANPGGLSSYTHT